MPLKKSAPFPLKQTPIPILLLLTIFFLQSCGVVRSGADRTTQPSASAETVRMLQTGVASWYGPDFHGKATANGETYNMNDLTAAHRTLPFNTVVKVDNLDNGRSVVVRINDRGPYVGDRVIDLSRKAAQDIEMIDTGTANVEIHLISEGDRPVAAGLVTNKETYTIQLASFNTQREADTYSNRVRGSRVQRVTFGNRTAYRVYYGSFSSSADARAAQQQLSSRGHEGFVKQAEN